MSTGSRAFERVEALYEELGESQALWAVMTYPEYRDDKNLDDFLSSGVSEIDLQMGRLNQLGLSVQPGRCLDFGCGVGRLSNALASHFAEVVGVDVSSTMLEKAEQIKMSDNLTFVLNKSDNLDCLEPETFDFVYSNKTIQHIGYPASKHYIQGFLRCLKPGGMAAFLVHDCKHREEGSLSFNLTKWHRENVRPFFKKLRRKPPVHIHPISSRNVKRFVESAGGGVLHFETDTGYTKRRRGNLRTWYWARKK